MGEFMRQRFDFEVFRLDGFGIALNLIHERLNQRRHLGFSGGIDIQMIKFSE